MAGGRSGPTGRRATTSRPGRRYPVVTGLQEVADLIAGFSAPSGRGHR